MPRTAYRFVLAALVSATLAIFAFAALSTETRTRGPGPASVPGARVLDLAHPLPEFIAEDQFGRKFALSQLQRKWTFIYFAPDDCGRRCRDRLNTLGYINRTTVDDRGLDNTQVVALAAQAGAGIRTLAQTVDRRILVPVGDGPARQLWLNTLCTAKKKGLSPEQCHDSLLLVDPLSRLRAWFPGTMAREEIAAAFVAIRERYGDECCIGSGTFETVVIRKRPQ